MSRRAKGPRLYLDPKRRQWIVRDGAAFMRTGLGERDAGAAETFLARYISGKHRPAASAAPLIAEILDAYMREIVPLRLSARALVYNIGSLLRWWGDKSVNDITAGHCRAYIATKSPIAANADLKVLRAAVNHWHVEHGPLDRVPPIRTLDQSRRRERWLTRSEAARLLQAARRVQHLRRAILLGLYTGSRPGVILRLQWDQIDFAAGVMDRRRPGETVSDTKRAPRVRLGRRILSHLRRWRRTDPVGVLYLCHYDGVPVRELRHSWHRAATAAGLPGITPHVLRHTRATWLMQAGISAWEAAGALGMTVRTLEAVYGHHHVAWQRDAAEV